MTDQAIETCVVDHCELLECYGADENGIRTYYICAGPGEHTYRSQNDGYGPYPVDQGDYEGYVSASDCPHTSESGAPYGQYWKCDGCGRLRAFVVQHSVNT